MRCGQVHYYKVLNCCVAIGNMCCFSGICLCSQGNLTSMWFTFLFYSLNNIHSCVSFLTIWLQFMHTLPIQLYHCYCIKLVSLSYQLTCHILCTN